MSASLRLTPLDYLQAQAAPAVNGGIMPFILTIDGGRGLGYWQERLETTRYGNGLQIIHQIQDALCYSIIAAEHKG